MERLGIRDWGLVQMRVMVSPVACDREEEGSLYTLPVAGDEANTNPVAGDEANTNPVAGGAPCTCQNPPTPPATS